MPSMSGTGSTGSLLQLVESKSSKEQTRDRECPCNTSSSSSNYSGSKGLTTDTSQDKILQLERYSSVSGSYLADHQIEVTFLFFALAVCLQELQAQASLSGMKSLSQNL